MQPVVIPLLNFWINLYCEKFRIIRQTKNKRLIFLLTLLDLMPPQENTQFFRIISMGSKRLWIFKIGLSQPLFISYYILFSPQRTRLSFFLPYFELFNLIQTHQLKLIAQWNKVDFCISTILSVLMLSWWK